MAVNHTLWLKETVNLNFLWIQIFYNSKKLLNYFTKILPINYGKQSNSQTTFPLLPHNFSSPSIEWIATADIRTLHFKKSCYPTFLQFLFTSIPISNPRKNIQKKIYKNREHILLRSLVSFFQEVVFLVDICWCHRSQPDSVP